jgi:hypothetical protein
MGHNLKVIEIKKENGVNFADTRINESLHTQHDIRLQNPPKRLCILDSGLYFMSILYLNFFLHTNLGNNVSFAPVGIAVLLFRCLPQSSGVPEGLHISKDFRVVCAQ